ncbi:MAG: hypothetical protein H6707_17925 [Deltaproteobacteria bacterium]|nr:hypothetical protein [Deltaproteobacteria bacterium]
MPKKPNYDLEKRRKEAAKRKRKEEKRQRRRQTADDTPSARADDVRPAEERPPLPRVGDGE